MTKHSRTVNNILFILTAAALIGCGEEPRRTDYAARVNNSYLTEQDIDRIIDSPKGNNFYRNEIIKNWINREMLFQKAQEEGILEEDLYRSVIEDSRKELAAAMLLQKVWGNENIRVEKNELEEYFNLNKDEFRLNENYYLINKSRFSKEDFAVDFRGSVMENSWENAVEDFTENKQLVANMSPLFLAEQEIHPVSALRIIKELYPGEVSIVLNEAPQEFTVIQMLQKYEEGTIPPWELIREKLSNRLMNRKKEELIKNYIKDLYSEYEIEVRQEKR